MDEAVAADCLANQKDQPGLSKLRLVPVMLNKLKHAEMQRKFLDQDGLHYINRFISRQPDGSWPLSSVRGKVLDLIYQLPCEPEHLQNIKLGQTLETQKNSHQEFKESKKIIQTIKDKWSRKICNISIEYTTLESQEKDLKSQSTVIALNKKSKGKDDSLLGKREASGETIQSGLDRVNPYEYNERIVGYNFTVRPANTSSGRDYGTTAASSKQTLNSEVTKHLMRCRKTR